jgi:hypothetical protein
LPSRDRLARLVLVVVAFGFAATAIGATVSRSLIPRALDATVDAVEVRVEKHPGIDDVWLVYLDGDAVHVDAATARQLDAGMAVHKTAWATTLTADGASIPLALSAEARAMLWVMPLTVLAAVVATRLRRSSPAKHPDPEPRG